MSWNRVTCNRRARQSRQRAQRTGPRLVESALITGAAATTAIDATTYLDMLLRGRPASSAPIRSAGMLSERLGVDLGDGDAGQNRRQGLGALLGYATGIGVGLGYGLVGARLPLRLPVAAAAVGAAAMAVSDIPMAVTGVTDPRDWTVADWLADAVPHLVYGLATVGIFRRLHPRVS